MELRTILLKILALVIAVPMYAQSMNDASAFFVGTYTGGASEGIYTYIMHTDGTLDSIGLAAQTSNPTFMAVTDDGQYLVSISEVSSANKTGMVKSYRISDHKLEFISESSSMGANPCFVAINSEGFVVVANYTGGNVALYKINEQGELTEPLDMKQHTGSDITDRQKGPHAHSAWFDPKNNNVIGVDLGTNDLWIYAFDEASGKLTPANPPLLSMEPGAGPRHLDFHPNGKWIYVLNELNSTLSLVTRNGKHGYKLSETFSTLPPDYTGKNSCADIHVSSDGQFIYASNRGHNSLAIFKVNKKDGTLTSIGHQSVHGDIPRNFSISPCGKYIVVANQNSGNIVSFLRDKDTGQMKYVDEINAPKPVCIRFF